MGFPGGSAGKESACEAGDLSSIPGLGRSPGERKGYPLRYSGLENSLECIVHGVAKSRTQLRDFHKVVKSLASTKSSVEINKQLDVKYDIKTVIRGREYKCRVFKMQLELRDQQAIYMMALSC